MTTPPRGTPIWVWVVYGLGILAACVFAFSLLFTAGAYIVSDDVPVSLDVSVTWIVVWGGLLLLALGIWIRRRWSGRR